MKCKCGRKIKGKYVPRLQEWGTGKNEGLLMLEACEHGEVVECRRPKITPQDVAILDNEPALSSVYV